MIVDFSTFSPDSLKSYDAFLNAFIYEITSTVQIFNDREEKTQKKPKEKLQLSLEFITITLDKRVVIFLDEIDRLIDQALRICSGLKILRLRSLHS